MHTGLSGIAKLGSSLWAHTSTICPRLQVRMRIRSLMHAFVVPKACKMPSTCCDAADHKAAALTVPWRQVCMKRTGSSRNSSLISPSPEKFLPPCLLLLSSMIMRTVLVQVCNEHVRTRRRPCSGHVEPQRYDRTRPLRQMQMGSPIAACCTVDRFSRG